MKKGALAVLVLALLFLALLAHGAGSEPGEVVFLVDAGLAGGAGTARAGTGGQRVLWVGGQESADPIANGRLLSGIEYSGRVIAVGEKSRAWAVAELTGRRVYFVGTAAQVPSNLLSARGWAGCLGSSLDGVFDAVRRLGWRRITVLGTPPYLAMRPALAAAAKAHGVDVRFVAVRAGADLPDLMRGLPRDVDAVWVLGDPKLTGGPAFDFLVEFSLARGTPLIVPDPALLPKGGFMAIDPDWSALLRWAANTLPAGRAGGGVEPAPVPGSVRIHEVLARRWGISWKEGRP